VYELAPWGPSTASIDGRAVAGIGGEPRAVLGAGVTFAVDLGVGDHIFAVQTCPGRQKKGPRGFYLRRLASASANAPS
jgi:hypothetical protein